jgi:AcrR family transcriptional regulator
MPSTALQIAETDPRRVAILTGAVEVFARYGYRRTSMEDIARGVGVSRAALYLHYRNKPDIFRSLVMVHFEVSIGRVAQALQPGLAPEQALAAVFKAKIGPETAVLFDSPHGEELLDANFAVAADVVEQGEARIRALLRAWLQAEADAGRITLAPYGGDADALAETIVAALSGLKSCATGYDALCAAFNRMAQLFGRGLRA